MPNLVFIKTYQNRMEAELTKGILESNGIKAMISADDAGGMYPVLLLATGGVRLLIKKKDAQRVIKILKGINK